NPNRLKTDFLPMVNSLFLLLNSQVGLRPAHSSYISRTHVETWRYCDCQWRAHALWAVLRENQGLYGAGTGRGRGQGGDRARGDRSQGIRSRRVWQRAADYGRRAVWSAARGVAGRVADRDSGADSEPAGRLRHAID